MVRKIRIKKDRELVKIEATSRPYVVLDYEARGEPKGTHLTIHIGTYEYRFDRFGKQIPTEDDD